MHWSLIPERAKALETPLPPPPCPLFDIHMHSASPRATAPYVRAARQYGALGACNLEFSGCPDDMHDHFPAFIFMPCGWPRIDKGVNWTRFRKRWVNGFPDRLDEGLRAIKFKSEPRDGARPSVWLDDPRIAPLLELCSQHRIPVQAHIAQPSAWWPDRYDPTVAGAKQEYLDQVERMLAAHPDLTYIGVHMGGIPEDLPYLDHMLATYPGYHLETSATKWVVRELSAKPEAARAFFLRWQDRICFGTDLVVQDGIDFDYYTSRFYVQRLMWEGRARGLSMIQDPDAPPEGPYLNGLGLPPPILRKLYWQNAARLLPLPACG